MKIVVFSGAGISKSSGVKLYSFDDGIWDDENWKRYSTPQSWKDNPKTVLDFYNWRRIQLGKCKPNRAHLLLAKLQEKHQVEIITQNVDDLHERAGSRSVLHLHGKLTLARPEGTFNKADGYDTRYVRDIGYSSIGLGECGGPNNTQIRPHVLFFGEQMPNEFFEAQHIIFGGTGVTNSQQADVLIVIGTSLQVEPASILVKQVIERDCGIQVFLIDPRDEPAELIPEATHIRKEAFEGLLDVVELMGIGKLNIELFDV